MSNLKLRKEIYSQFVIEKAILAYQGLVQAELINDGDYIKLRFHNIRCPENMLNGEFENYLIDLTCKEKKW